MMMNSFLGIGRIASTPTTVPAGHGQEAEVTFDLSMDRVGRKAPDVVTCVLVGERALCMGPVLRKGALVGVSGSIETAGRECWCIMVAEVNSLSRPEKAARAVAAEARR